MRRRDRDTLELEDLRRENERLRSRLTLLEAEMAQSTRPLTRASLAEYLTLGLETRIYRGVDGIVYDVLDLLDNAVALYGKEAVRKALYLDD